MKKLLLVSAVLMVAACGDRQADTPPAGETTGEMAPMTADTGMGMTHDTSMMSSDTMMARDSVAQ